MIGIDSSNEGSRASTEFMYDEADILLLCCCDGGISLDLFSHADALTHTAPPSLMKYLKEDSNEFVFEFSD